MTRYYLKDKCLYCGGVGRAILTESSKFSEVKKTQINCPNCQGKGFIRGADITNFLEALWEYGYAINTHVFRKYIEVVEE